MAIPQFVAGVALTAAELNVIVDRVDFTAWTAVSFTNSWVNAGAPNQVCQYQKVGDRVYLRGVMASGTNSATAFTLPAGFRPPATIFSTQNAGGAFGTLAVLSSGAVQPTGSTAYFSIDFDFSVTA